MYKNKIILSAIILGFQFAVADTTKAQLLSSMNGGSASGGLVNNNVNYGNQNNTQTQTQQPQTQGINLLAPQNQNYTKPISNQPVKKHYKKKVVKKQQTINVASQKIDITYFGDVSGVPNLLTQYFPGLIAAPALGKSISQSVSFDMQAVTIDDISAMIQSLTSGTTRLIYNPSQNTIRVSYVTVTENANGGKLTPEQQSQNWRDGKGKPKPIMTDSGVLLYPYGQYEPTVVCRPQQVCDIQFEAGEKIIDAVMGDTQRWIVQGVISGVGKNSVQHIVLKPQYPDLNTNMIITTDKGRTYNLKLVSSEKNYVSAVSWYYPQEINNKMMRDFNQKQNQDTNPNQNTNQSSSSINPGLSSTANGIQVKGTQNSDDSDELSALNLDFRYKISGDNVIWKPLRVFNDGVHTFIEVNPKSLNVPAPVFMVYEPYSGNYEMVNYRQKGNYYIVDQMFNEAVFIYDVGYNQQKVSISHILDSSKENKNWLY